MKSSTKHIATLLACSALIGCAGFTENLTATGKALAPKIGGVLAKVAIDAAFSTLTGGEKANLLDSAAQGLRSAWTTEDTEKIVKIWTTPPKESTAPEMKAVAAKAAELAKQNGAGPETMAMAFNIAAAKVRSDQ